MFLPTSTENEVKIYPVTPPRVWPWVKICCRSSVSWRSMWPKRKFPLNNMELWDSQTIHAWYIACIYHKFKPNVGKYTIHGWYKITNSMTSISSYQVPIKFWGFEFVAVFSCDLDLLLLWLEICANKNLQIKRQRTDPYRDSIFV